MQRALHCSASDYFRSALLGSFSEAKDKKLRLPGCDTAVFELFLYWICNKTLPNFETQTTGLSWDDEDYAASEEFASKIQALLARLWYVAGMYLLPVLQNDTMNRLLDVMQNVQVEPTAMEIAFDIGPPDCLLRKMLLEEFVWDWVNHPGTPFRRPQAMAEFAKIPGFFAAFAGVVHPIADQSLSHASLFDEELRSSYMVPISNGSFDGEGAAA